DVLEQLLPGQVLAAPDDRGQAAVAQSDLVKAAGLAAKSEPHGASPDRGVSVAEGRQSERAVQTRVFVVADADQGQLEEPDDRRQDLFAVEAGSGEVVVDLRPDLRQGRRKC